MTDTGANKLLSRFGSFGAGLLMAGFVLIGGFLMLAGGYWLSDRVYDAGVWPLGALMRIVLLFMLLGFGVTVIFLVVASVASLFRGADNV
jgi:hypothetical protein